LKKENLKLPNSASLEKPKLLQVLLLPQAEASRSWSEVDRLGAAVNRANNPSFPLGRWKDGRAER